MSKRFIDTEIFNDSWFMDLSVNAKLLYIYLITNCDHAGIIDINWKLVEFQTGIKQLAKSYETLTKEYGNRLLRLQTSYYFIPRFITFQYPNFPNSNVRQQLGAIKRLKEFNLFDEENLTVSKELTNSYEDEHVNDTVNVNDTVKEEKKKKSLFKNSGIIISDIETAFKKTDDLINADSKHYFNRMLDASESKGLIYTDWIATARSWARKDLAEDKLILKKQTSNPKMEF